MVGSKTHLHPDADKDIMTGESVVSTFDGRFSQSSGVISETLTENEDYEPYVSQRPSVKDLERLDSTAASIHMLRKLLSEVQATSKYRTTYEVIMEWLGEYTVERAGYRGL
jgi:hypothetical protein